MATKKSPAKKKEATGLATKEEFWALKGISMEVKKGEVIGIIGRNGAGKSTLLKVLSQITPPTEGEITIKGRVGSLLEVGTGFHPELTGRENIFLNGAILGMTRREIAKKFNQIVEFAGIDKFLDTPVKHYSSGMYVRLAFSVAAHLDPDILIVDEVLAVGDAEFQKKCLGKMDEITKQDGRTIIFVSHNLSAIQSICKKGVLLENGRIKVAGDIKEVINEYTASSFTNPSLKPIKSGIAEIRLLSQDLKGNNKDTFFIGEPVRFKVELNIERPIVDAELGIGILDPNGERVVTFHTMFQHAQNWGVRKTADITADWQECILCPGIYHYEIALYENKIQTAAIWQNIGQITILESDYFGTGKLPNPQTQGKVVVKAKWKIEDK